MKWADGFYEALYGLDEQGEPPEVKSFKEFQRTQSFWNTGNTMSVEIREIIAKRAKADAEIAALQRWAAGGQKEPLTPELKARWLEMVAEHDGVICASRTMDSLATQPMPEVMQ